MIYLLLSLAALGIISALIGLLSHNKERSDHVVLYDNDCSTCNGENSKCEQECMMEASVRPIEYFDDEELDTFAGRPSDSYSEAETEQFSDVLYTMRPDEVAPWTRSLTLRGIQLPDQLKDEVLMLISDNR